MCMFHEIVSIDLCFKHSVLSLWYHFEGHGASRIWKQVVRGELWRLLLFLKKDWFYFKLCGCLYICSWLQGHLKARRGRQMPWSWTGQMVVSHLMWLLGLNWVLWKEQSTGLITEPSFQAVIKVLFSCILPVFTLFLVCGISYIPDVMCSTMPSLPLWSETCGIMSLKTSCLFQVVPVMYFGHHDKLLI